MVVLLTWLYLSSYILLFGAELNSELEHQTAEDTTGEADKPMGDRGAGLPITSHLTKRSRTPRSTRQPRR